jgi:hypothetical protein
MRTARPDVQAGDEGSHDDPGQGREGRQRRRAPPAGREDGPALILHHNGIRPDQTSYSQRCRSTSSPGHDRASAISGSFRRPAGFTFITRTTPGETASRKSGTCRRARPLITAVTRHGCA